MQILAISGSLRKVSINSAFCHAAARLATHPLEIDVFSGLGALPLFNPDIDLLPPASVQAFRSGVGRADALIIASPEYAHGVSGVMKNALDWLVGFEGTVGKPIALINTSPRAHHAYESLREILRTMSTILIAEAVIPLLDVCTTEEAMVSSPEVSRAIGTLLESVTAQLAGARVPGPSFPLA